MLQVPPQPERQNLGRVDAFAVRLCEIARAVLVDDALHAAGLLGVSTVSFKAGNAAGDSQELRQVSAGGIAQDPDSIRIDATAVRVRAEPAHGGFDIVNRR